MVYDLSDLVLTRTNDDRTEIAIDEATISSSDNMSWTLSDLRGLTAASGIYELSVVAAESQILSESGIPMTEGTSATWINGAGDANQDGRFDTADLIDVFKVAQFEDDIEKNSIWSSGDWNGDGDFDTSDLIAAFQHGQFERS